MKHLFLKTLGLQETEFTRAVLMFFYIFFIIASLLIIKPVRNSLFLVEIGPVYLPYAFILVAVASILVAVGYSRITARVKIIPRTNFSLLFFIVSLLGIWILLSNGYRKVWFIYTIYIWVAIYGALAASQFWLLANLVFNVREAKRTFGFLGMGAISGGIFGGYFTRILAPISGTESLFLFAISFLVLCIFILRFLSSIALGRINESGITAGRIYKKESGTENPIKIITKSRHLTYITIIVGIGVIVANLVDFQFNTIASKMVHGSDDLTAFFGFWMSNLSIISLLIQVFLTQHILRSLGVGATLYFLPIGIFLAAGAILIIPGLITAVIIKVTEGGLKQSLNKSGIELLSLPLSNHVKNQTKSFIDIFVDNAATGLGGILLLILSLIPNSGIKLVSLLIIVHTGIWVFFINKVKREYVNAFRSAIERRSIDVYDPSIKMADSEVFQSFLNILEGKNDRQILYVLRLIENTRDSQIAGILKKLITHHSVEIKEQVLKMASRIPEADISTEAFELVTNENQIVRRRAIQYLYLKSGRDSDELNRYLQHEDYRVQTAAMICLVTEYKGDPTQNENYDIIQLFKSIYTEGIVNEEETEISAFLKKNAAEVIGISGNKLLYKHLSRLLQDSSSEVVKEAVKSAGLSRDPIFLPRLFELMQEKTYRQPVKQALTNYGDEILGVLEHRLIDEKQPAAIRTEIPHILDRIGSRKAAKIIFDNLDQEDLKFRYELYKAILHLRIRRSDIKFPRKKIEYYIVQEAENYYGLLAVLSQHKTKQEKLTHMGSRSNGNQAANELMIKVLRERLDSNLERIFRLLALMYPPDDIYNAYRRIIGGNPELHANAVEFIDNLLDPNLRKYIIPIIEYDSIEKLSLNLTDLHGPSIRSADDYRKVLLSGSDTWLQVTTLFLVAHSGRSNLLPLVENLRLNPLPIIRETAEYASQRLKPA